MRYMVSACTAWDTHGSHPSSLRPPLFVLLSSASSLRVVILCSLSSWVDLSIPRCSSDTHPVNSVSPCPTHLEARMHLEVPTIDMVWLLS